MNMSTIELQNYSCLYDNNLKRFADKTSLNAVFAYFYSGMSFSINNCQDAWENSSE